MDGLNVGRLCDTDYAFDVLVRLAARGSDANRFVRKFSMN